jgi:hypothetical protein
MSEATKEREMKYQLVQRHPQVKRPCDVFKSCPRCKSDVLLVDADVLCSQCDWNSIEMYVGALIEAQARDARAKRPEGPRAVTTVQRPVVKSTAVSFPVPLPTIQLRPGLVGEAPDAA